MSNQKPTHVRLPIESVPDLRKALTHGLYAMVEVIRVRSLAESEKAFGRSWHEDGMPIMPAQNEAGSLEPIASALLWLESMEELPKRTP